MKETLMIIIVIVVLYLIVLFVIIKPFNKRVKRQQKFLESVSKRAKNLLEKQSKDSAIYFIKRMFPIIVKLKDEAFDGFGKLSEYISYIGDDYSEEETINRFLRSEYKKEDIQQFAEFFLETIID